MKMLIALAALLVIFMLPSLWIGYIAGWQPKHCQYLVPVKTHPGIYACSEYPKAKVKP